MYQSITIIGYVGRDAEMRYTPTGQAVTSFSVATTNGYTSSNGENVKETSWFRVSVWGKLAEICNKYVKKGSLVAVEGRLTADKATGSPRIWTKQDGSTGTSFELNARTVKFLNRVESDRGEEVSHSEDTETEEVPF